MSDGLWLRDFWIEDEWSPSRIADALATSLGIPVRAIRSLESEYDSAGSSAFALVSEMRGDVASMVQFFGAAGGGSLTDDVLESVSELLGTALLVVDDDVDHPFGVLRFNEGAWTRRTLVPQEADDELILAPVADNL